jgi:quercetin dioxygenase-like cupin family protein
MTEDRDQSPRVTNPHGFNVAWLRAAPGEGVLRHRSPETQVLIVRSGRWRLTLDEAESILESRDTVSVPTGSWRALRNEADVAGELIVVNGGDGRVHLEWDPQVVEAAHAADVGLDANGYISRWSLVRDTVAHDEHSGGTPS